MQTSGLVGILVFLQQIWNYAPFERILYLSLGAGTAVYLVLAVGYLSIHHIVQNAPAEEEPLVEAGHEETPEADAEGGASAERAAREPVASEAVEREEALAAAPA